MSEEEVIKRLKQTIQLDKEVFGQNSKNFEIEEILLNYIEKLQKENKGLKRVKRQSQEILSRLKIIYMVHTKDCELTLKDIEKWEKILDK